MSLPAHVPPPARAAVAEAHDEPDVDPLAVPRGDYERGDYEPWVERKRTGRVRRDRSVPYSRDVSIQPFSVEEAADESRPLMSNAAREGVRL